MLKCIGVLIVISTSILIAKCFFQKKVCRLEILQELQQLGILMRADIRHSSVTVPDAIKGIQLRVHGKVREFLHIVLDKMDSRDRENIEKMWHEAIQLIFCKTELIKEDIVILERIGRIMGFLDKQLQIENLDQYILEIEEQIDKSKKEIDEKRRIYRIMGMFVGILIVLVFI